MTSAGNAAYCRRYRLRTIAGRKATALAAAVAAITPEYLLSARALHAYCDAHQNWVLALNCSCPRSRAPIYGPNYSIHHSIDPRGNLQLESLRIARFFHWLRHKRVRVRPVVTGTAHGPDVMLRLADGGIAALEIKGPRGQGVALPMMKHRYAHLQDCFRVYLAVEARSGMWTLLHLAKDETVEVGPEALRG